MGEEAGSPLYIVAVGPGVDPVLPIWRLALCRFLEVESSR
jgi:hypothetical protein